MGLGRPQHRCSRTFLVELTEEAWRAADAVTRPTDDGVLVQWTTAEDPALWP